MSEAAKYDKEKKNTLNYSSEILIDKKKKKKNPHQISYCLQEEENLLA